MRFKKEVFLISFIITFIVALEIITNMYTDKIVDEMSKDTENVMNELYNRNVDDSIEKLKEKWLEKEGILSCYVEHDELDQVTSSLLFMEENAKNKEYEQALTNGRDFMFWLNHFKEKDKLILKNIL